MHPAVIRMARMARMARRSRGVALALALGAPALACSGEGGGGSETATTTTTGESTGSPDGSTTAAASGAVVLRFAVPNGARESPNLKSPLVGAIYGAIFRTEDVTLTGPVDGAETFGGSIEVLNVDVQTVDVSESSWTSGPIPPGEYTFLGFYDLNGNGAEQDNPDAGDLATLPSVNKFTITEGQQVELVASFDIVL